MNSVLYLDWDRKGFPYPVVPFTVNAYGRWLIAAHGGAADAVAGGEAAGPRPSSTRRGRSRGAASRWAPPSRARSRAAPGAWR